MLVFLLCVLLSSLPVLTFLTRSQGLEAQSPFSLLGESRLKWAYRMIGDFIINIIVNNVYMSMLMLLKGEGNS